MIRVLTKNYHPHFFKWGLQQGIKNLVTWRINRSLTINLVHKLIYL